MRRTPAPTARLEFRRWNVSDAALAASLWCDPQVMRYIGGPYSEDEVTARIERELANDVRYAIQYWPLFTIENGQFVGCCGLKPHNVADSTLEIGFQLLPDFWGAGYASEAAHAVIAYAFGELHTTAIYAGRHPHNAASHKVLTKLGFTQIGTHYFARTAPSTRGTSCTAADSAVSSPHEWPSPRPSTTSPRNSPTSTAAFTRTSTCASRGSRRRPPNTC